MCGIVGAFWRDPAGRAERLLSDAVTCLHLRGPDDRGVEVERLASGTLGFGHARLSVIDLSSGGHQPMRTPDGRFAMVFNGELYNYRELRDELRSLGRSFRTQSDSEVLLAAWGQWGSDCLRRLEGMFAFVVHDRERETLSCARDAFGIKPLFFVTEDGRFLFSSTQRALVALRGQRPEPDLQRCYDYLVHSDYDSDDRTFVKGVRQLRPGHWMELDLRSGTVSEPRCWWAASWRPGEFKTLSQSIDAVREVFLDSVRLQLRSDVPIGAALSGGVDSSAVVCAMRHVDPSLEIKTFSYVARGTPLDEERWADLVNGHVGAQSYKVTATAADLRADLDDMLEAQEEPFISTSIYAQYRVFKLAREQGVTVTLDGQGADEVLAGYSGYPGFRLLSLLETGRLGRAHSFAKSWAAWPGRSYKLAAMELGRTVFPDALYAHARRTLGRDFKPDWLDIGMLADERVRFAENRPGREADARGRRVPEQLAKSLQQRGLPALLRHADRNSMRFSVESRVPFLTVRLANLLLSLPEEHLISDQGETKHVFRAAMRGIVPDAILDRRDKIGFATPEQEWLLEIAPSIRNIVAEGAAAIPFIRADALMKRFDAMIAGRIPFSWQLWRWTNFARWYQQMAFA